MKRTIISREILSTVVIGLLLLGMAACSDNNGSGPPPAPPQAAETAFVLTTDFTTGSYSTIDLDTLAAAIDLPSQTGIVESDNDGVYYNFNVYILNRFGSDNITVVDTFDVTTAVSQFSTGNGTNPQDIAFVSDTKAYVSLLGDNNILIVDPTDVGNEIINQIDLSGFATSYNDPDGIVEASPMVIVDRYLFVGLQFLDQNSFFSPTTVSVLAVIDTTTDIVVDINPATPELDGIILSAVNPIYMRYDETLQKIVVSEVGNYGAMDGGIETVDPVTFLAEGLISTETQLGGDVGDFVLVNDSKGYVVIGNFPDPNKVVVFDVASGDKTGELTVASPFIPSLALDSQMRLLVPDRTDTDPGVRIYDTTTDTEVTTSPIDVGLPPNVILVY